MRNGHQDRREGLAWLGRQPEAGASTLLRACRWLARLVAVRVVGFHVRVEGAEHRPAGGCILACALHRSWIDPLVLVGAFPVEPRLWYLGSAETTFRSRSRAWFMHRLGGILPVWRGGTDVDVHVGSARAVIAAGAVFAIFPEGSRRGSPTELAPFRRGVGLIGLRTAAPIVPAVLAGTGELYRGRRIALRVLPSTSALDLSRRRQAPEAGTADELEAARAATDALAALLAPHVAELATWCEDPPETPRRWRWMSDLIR